MCVGIHITFFFKGKQMIFGCDRNKQQLPEKEAEDTCDKKSQR